MVAVKTPSLTQTYASLCSFLKTNPKLTVVVANHIAAKHQIHSLPAFHTTDAVSEQDKLVTYGEIIRALVSKDHTKLKGQLANGQAEHVEPAPTPAPVEDRIPTVMPARTPEPTTPQVLLNGRGAIIPTPAEQKEKDGRAALARLRKLGFIGERQAKGVLDFMRGEEKEFFFDKMIDLLGVVEKMPSTGHSDGTAYLHYFAGGQANWFISEKDKGSPDDEAEGVLPQSQAFGLADMFGRGTSDCAEVGYISIAEILENDGELDFHWEPKSIDSIRKQEPATAKQAAPVGETSAPSALGEYKPRNHYEMHRQLDALLDVASDIPGATITLQISLPSHC